MRNGNFTDTLRYVRKESVSTTLHFYWLGHVAISEKIVLDGASFLESLWRGMVPFIGRGVTYPVEQSERWYPGVYVPRKSNWNDYHAGNLPFVVLNERAYNRLDSLIDSFDWIDGIDYDDLHADCNAYLVQIVCGAECLDGAVIKRENR